MTYSNRALVDPGDTTALLESLSAIELRALEVMLDPDRFGSDMATLARAIPCSPDKLRRIRRSSAWQAAYRSSLLLRLDRHLPKILDAAIANALNPTVAGHADRKMLFVMAGFYVERRQAVPEDRGPGHDAPRPDVGARLESARRMMRQTVTTTETVEFGDDDDEGPNLTTDDTIDADSDEIDPV